MMRAPSAMAASAAARAPCELPPSSFTRRVTGAAPSSETASSAALRSDWPTARIALARSKAGSAPTTGPPAAMGWPVGGGAAAGSGDRRRNLHRAGGKAREQRRKRCDLQTETRRERATALNCQGDGSDRRPVRCSPVAQSRRPPASPCTADPQPDTGIPFRQPFGERGPLKRR